MRSAFETAFYVNGSKEKNGIVPVMGRVAIDGTAAQVGCKQRISKKTCIDERQYHFTSFPS